MNKLKDMPEVCNILKQARTHVYNGWTKGRYIRLAPDGHGGVVSQYCIVGSIMRSGIVSDISNKEMALALLGETLVQEGKIQRRDISNLIDYNDTVTTQKADILRVFDKTLENCK